MYLATQNDGTADGRLVVVSRDLCLAVPATGIAATMQMALDTWQRCEDELQELSDALHGGHAKGAFQFDAKEMLAPLPRAWQWLDASAFPTHGDLMQKAFNHPPLETNPPLMYQGMSHRFLSATEDVPFPSEADGIDFEGEFGIITDAVPMGTKAADARHHIRLVVQINDWSLRNLAPREMKTGFGWIHAKPACSMAPLAITPDELGEAWQNARVAANLRIWRNDALFGDVPATEMEFGFDELIAHAAYCRDLCPGTVIGSGTVSNRDYKRVGSCCIAERRAIEAIVGERLRTELLSYGERVRMDAHRHGGETLFGLMDQRIRSA